MKKLKGLDVCHLYVSRGYKVPTPATKTLADINDPRYWLCAEKYAWLEDERYRSENKGFWLVMVDARVQLGRVKRSWVRRRLKNAVTDRLRAYGFDTSGRRLDPTPGSDSLPATAQHDYTRLIGIAELHPKESSFETKFEEVQNQADIIVQYILTQCGWPIKLEERLSGNLMKRGARNVHGSKHAT